jgi:hypothetical protein
MGDKRVVVGFPVKQDGEIGVGFGPFEIGTVGEDFAIIPSVLIAEKPEKAAMSKAMLERLIPKHLLKKSKKDLKIDRPFAVAGELERISDDIEKVLEFFVSHNVMDAIDRASGQKNDARYMAYAVQAYYMGVLK